VRELLNFVKGPFKDESAFKSAVLKVWREKYPNFTRFEIENEEKEPGMPDCLSMSEHYPAFFTEFKVSNSKGVIEFEKTQPLFYKRHPKLIINILAWDRKRGRVVSIEPKEVIKTGALKMQISEELNDVKAVS